MSSWGVTPSTGAASRLEAPPESSTQTSSSGATAAAAPAQGLRGRQRAGAGLGMVAGDDGEAGVRCRAGSPAPR